METVSRDNVRALMKTIQYEYGLDSIKEVAEKMAEETGMAAKYFQAAYCRGGLSFPAYRLSGILLADDPGKPEIVDEKVV